MSTFNQNLIESLGSLVENTDTLNIMQKNRARGILKFTSEKLEYEDTAMELVKDVAKEKNILEIISFTTSLIIYTSKEKEDGKDVIYYKAIYFSDKYDKWVRLARIAETFEEVVVSYVAVKYDGENTQADFYFTKMIGMYDKK